jgi:pimeloyl-[acyl-carrier protein] methyl ester esterase
MTLYTQTSGSGPDLVLIHGWGLHGGVWDVLVPLLEASFRVTRVDLPGHGRSAWRGAASLDDMSAAVLSVAPESATWLGWSMGSLIAARAALTAPARIDRLVLLAGTPCFVRRPGWQPAMLPALLDTFATELQRDYVKTLNRFLSLQVRSSDHAAVVLRRLREKLLAHGPPVPAALSAGLEILRRTDLRDRFPQISCPTLFLMGKRDTLVPVSAGEQAAQRMPDARVQVIEGAGHAPFMAQPQQVADILREFPGTAQQARAGVRHG